MQNGVDVIIQDMNVLGNGQLVHNWGTLVREGLAGKGIQNIKAKTSQDVRTVGDNNIYNTQANKVKLNFDSPSTDSSGIGSVYGGSINNLANTNVIIGGGDRSPGDPNGGNGGIEAINNDSDNRRDDRDDKRRREFLFVKSSNVIITIFTGFNLNRNPYIPFNKSLRKFIITQGHDGEELLKILDHIETYGDVKFTNVKLKALADIYLKVYEYVRATNAALLNWIEGAAHGLVEHGCDNGSDVWRRLYNRYIPAAEDLQNLPMEEFMMPKPIAENKIDNLFIEIERRTEWYIKADGQGEAMNAKWVRAALIKNLPKSITQHLAIPLRQAQINDAVYNLKKDIFTRPQHRAS